MPLSHPKRLCTLLPFSISAALPTTPTSSALPSPPDRFQRAVPACAQPCLQASIFDRFLLACTSPTTLSCLCARYSIRGESLGEIALGCLYASCTVVDGSRTTAAYNICLGQAGAVTGTQTALTITLANTITVRSTTVPTPSTSSKSISSIQSVSSNSPTPPSVDIGSIPSTSFFTTLHSAKTSATAAATSTASAPTFVSPVMRPAQIAGLAAGAAAAFILAIVLMGLSVFLRRRREKRESEQPPEEQWQHFPAVRYSRTYPAQFPGAPPPGAIYSSDRQSGLAILSMDVITPTRTEGPAKKNGPRRYTGPTIRQLPTAKEEDTSTERVPLEQIGVAISDEHPTKSETTSGTRPKTLRFTLDSEQRPGSMMSQQTLFEEERRRSSKLLPTPPIPIAPARTLQQSSAYFTHSTTRPQPYDSSLGIPGPYPRMLVPKVSQDSARSQASVKGLAPPAELSRAASSTSSLGGSSSNIPDYYFTAHEPPSPPLAPVQTDSRTKQVEIPRGTKVRPKASSSTISRAPSRASSHDRGSMSSQTSFESADNDPTPEEEDVIKQLSPVAESPISMLRYPKVPRASNQLVPRSPRSRRTSQSQGSPRRQLDVSNSPLRRREGLDVLALDNRLKMDSPLRPGGKFPAKPYQRHTRGSSMETQSTIPPLRLKDRQSRVQSGHWVSSPLMYDIDAVEPLRIQSKHQDHVAPEMEAVRSPTWVPSLFPPASRRGDDLFFSVTYSKPGQTR